MYNITSTYHPGGMKSTPIQALGEAKESNDIKVMKNLCGTPGLRTRALRTRLNMSQMCRPFHHSDL